MGTTPPRPLTLEEARPEGRLQAIKEERTRAAVAAKAEETRTKVADALKAGKPFADAAKEAGQTVQDVPAYSQAEPASTDAGRVRHRADNAGAWHGRTEQIRADRHGRNVGVCP